GNVSSVRRTVLDNGIRVLTEPIAEFTSTTVGIWVENGSSYEPAEKNGISHFLEHLFFKGTERRSAKAIAEEIDSVGGGLNAFTAKGAPGFLRKAPPGRLAAAPRPPGGHLPQLEVRPRGDRARANGRAAGDLRGGGHARRLHPRPVKPPFLARPSAVAADLRN